VLIDAQEEAIAPRLCRLRRGRGCDEVNLILGMSVGLHMVVKVLMLLIRHLKLPPGAALANTHAILGRRRRWD